GDEVSEGAREVLADDRVAVDGAAPAGLDPLHRAPAPDAMRPGVELVVATSGAPLNDEPALIDGVPVGRALRIGRRDGAGLRLALVRAHGASVPSTRVAPVESIPPVPWATAMVGSGTWLMPSPL